MNREGFNMNRTPEQWWEKFLSQGKTESTKNTHRSRMRSIATAMGRSYEHMLDDLVLDQETIVDEFAEALVNAGLAVKTRRSSQSLIKQFGDWLCREGVHERRLYINVEPLTRNWDDVPDFLTSKDISDINSYIQTLDEEGRVIETAVLRAAYHSALRVGELLSLRPCDVQDEGSHGVISIQAKGSRERVRLFVHHHVLESFQQLATMRFKRFPEMAGDHPLFVTSVEMKAGKRDPRCKDILKGMNNGAVLVIVKRWGEKIGLKTRLKTHDLRHAAITHALDDGKSVQSVAAFARHSISSMQQYYDRKPGSRALNVAEGIFGMVNSPDNCVTVKSAIKTVKTALERSELCHFSDC